MQAAIHLLRKRLEVNEERKDFQKVFVRHVRHSDCREMKMTVWTLRYVVAEFLGIKGKYPAVSFSFLCPSSDCTKFKVL